MDLADVAVLQEVAVPGSDLVLRMAAPRNAGDKKRLDWGDVGSGGVLWDAAHILNALLVAHPALVVRASCHLAVSLWYACVYAELHRQCPQPAPLVPDAQPFRRTPRSLRTWSTTLLLPAPPNGDHPTRSAWELHGFGRAGGRRWRELLGMDM
jgi:hypothetical protein